MDKKKEQKEQPNIAFVGDGEPLPAINTATRHITLPEDQRKPFYHKDASFIIRTFPQLYKPISDKGAK